MKKYDLDMNETMDLLLEFETSGEFLKVLQEIKKS